MALGIQQKITGFEVAVDEFARVHIFECLEELVDDELLVDLLEDASADDDVQVCLHIVKYQIEILVILCLYYIEQSDDVFVAVQFLQEHYFPKCSLRICCVMKCIENFF